MKPKELDELEEKARRWAKDGANFGLIVSRIRREHPEVRREVIARWLMWALGSQKCNYKSPKATFRPRLPPGDVAV